MILGQEYRSTAPQGWFGYLTAVWQRRHFWTSLVMLDLQARYRRSVLGLGWSLANPVAMTCVLCVAFHNLFGLEIREYAPFVLTGMACWTFLVTSVNEGCLCFTRNECYIRAMPAPLAIYTLRMTMGAMVHFLIVLGVAILVTGLFRGFAGLPALLILPINLAILFVFAWSLTTICAFANIMFPDIQHLASVAMQLLFYLTPVFYPESTVRNGSYGALFQLNPFTHALALVRDPLLKGMVPSLTTYACAGLATLVFLSLALAIARRHERSVIFYI